jgi:hypothetical protein
MELTEYKYTYYIQLIRQHPAAVFPHNCSMLSNKRHNAMSVLIYHQLYYLNTVGGIIVEQLPHNMFGLDETSSGVKT